MIQRYDAPHVLRAPSGSYSQIVATHGLIFIAGQGPEFPDRNNIPETFAGQVTQVLINLRNALSVVDCELEHLVKINVYLSDLKLFDEFDEIYTQFMPEKLPARTTIASQLSGIEIEIDAIAARSDD